MPGMTTRRTSTQSLQQFAAQAKSDNPNEVDQIRDYDLNCEKAMQKKARACNVSYLVTGEEKGVIKCSTFPLLYTSFTGRNLWNILTLTMMIQISVLK